MTSDVENTAPKYRIGLVARLTGISAHQLRVWERRYKTVEPARSAGGDRLYSDSDVARLRKLKKLNDLGHSIGRVAHLSATELADLLEGHVAAEEPRDPLLLVDRIRTQFLQSIARMDILEAERSLARASVAFDPRVFVGEVLLPSLREVGNRWAGGEFTIAQEHGASQVLRTQLGALMRLYTPDVGARVVVCATLADELHEFGALAAALTAASNGWKVVYLGPNLPASEIANAVKTAQAELLLVSAVVARPELEQQLGSLDKNLPKGVRVILGGTGASKLSGLPARFQVLDSVEALHSAL